jgi:two-component system, response regulator
VLLVEDDPNDVFVALRALRGVGVEDVRVARDGVEALDLLGLHSECENPPARPRVILLDLQLPRLDGFEVLRELRRSEATRDIPVVVVSTSTRHSDIQAAYRLGANSYVVKRADMKRPGGHFADVVEYWLKVNQLPRSS